ncbi:MAG: rod shape-determining protein MreC [Candidatus Omnitrophota bacterium]
MFVFLTRKKSWIFATGILVLVFLVFFVPSFSVNLKNFSLGVFSSSIKFCSGGADYLRSRKVLVSQNKILRAKTDLFALEIERSKGLIQENERLRNLLGFSKKAAFSAIPAEIIARSPNGWEKSFVIDKGLEDGIKKNSAVCSAKGLLGKVTDPGQAASSVMLITHPSFRAGGVLENTRINGIVTGLGSGIVKIIYLPVDAEIKKGELVVTSGFSRTFPKGIVIGRIISVAKSKTGLYSYAMIKPSADPFKQEEVLCLV